MILASLLVNCQFIVAFLLFRCCCHSSAIFLMNSAQSTFVFLSVTSTYLISFKGSDSRKILATPHLSYSKSTLASWPGFIGTGTLVSFISCLGDSSMQTTGWRDYRMASCKCQGLAPLQQQIGCSDVAVLSDLLFSTV